MAAIIQVLSGKTMCAALEGCDGLAHGRFCLAKTQNMAAFCSWFHLRGGLGG
jgi:hypothetical protein